LPRRRPPSCSRPRRECRSWPWSEPNVSGAGRKVRARGRCLGRHLEGRQVGWESRSVASGCPPGDRRIGAQPPMTRRKTFQIGLLALLLLASPKDAPAFGETSRLVFVQGRYEGDWNPRPSALRRLAFELGTRTSIVTLPQEKVLPLDSPELFFYPFLYLSRIGPLPELSRAGRCNVRRRPTSRGL